MVDYARIFEEIREEVTPLFGQGHVANYIPALRGVEPRKFGMAVETIDGECARLGDAAEEFSIQSISKVFSLTLAISLVGDDLWHRVGLEPSGNPFNSLVQLEYERGIPRNPFINAGALVIADLLLDRLERPREELLAYVRKLACSDEIDYDSVVAASERSVGFTNAALVNFMKGHRNITHEVDEVLDLYCHQCAIEMTCEGLARAFLFLANGGVVPHSGERMLTVSQAKRINAVMLTCGFYDQAGEFAYRVGMPGKSGVGGGVVAVIPRRLALAVWSPELNDHSNSVVGIKALELFTTKTGVSIF